MLGSPSTTPRKGGYAPGGEDYRWGHPAAANGSASLSGVQRVLHRGVSTRAPSAARAARLCRDERTTAGGTRHRRHGLTGSSCSSSKPSPTINNGPFRKKNGAERNAASPSKPSLCKAVSFATAATPTSLRSRAYGGACMCLQSLRRECGCTGRCWARSFSPYYFRVLPRLPRASR